MDKVKKVINCYVPVTKCNFKCHYCYVGQENGFKGEIASLNHTPEFIAHALRKERLGGPCLLNFCACGETLLAPYIVELVKLLLQDGHYCTIVTNGTLSKRFDEILSIPEEALSRLFVKFSFHYLELKRLKLLEKFFSNIAKIKASSASYTVELTANDESIPYINEIKETCKKNIGALCHIIESRDMNNDLKRLTKLPVQEHLAAWNSFDTPLIHFQESTFEKPRKEFCYAGDWALTLYMDSGDLGYCLGYGKKIANIYDNTEAPITLCAIGKNCPWQHCWSSYFVLTNGCIPSLKTPYYGDLRNRNCQDGSKWLKSPVNEYFHSKLSESNKEYSEDKQYYINALQAEIWNNKSNKYSKEKLAKLVEKHLKSQNIKNIVVYGHDALRNWFIDILEKTSIGINYKLNKKSKWKKIRLYFDFRTDAVIITDYQNADKLKQQLKKYRHKTLSVTEIVK